MKNKTEGVALSFDQRGRVIENETFTCKHCQRIVVVPHKADPSQLGGVCYSCDALVCPQCYGRDCDHFANKLARAEAHHEALRSYGLI